MSERSTLLRGYAAAGLVVACWSGFNIVSRLGGRSVLTPFDLAALRFGVSALILLPWLLRRRADLDWERLAVLAVFGTLGYALLVYSGFARAPAAHAGVIVNGGIPFFTALFAWPVLGFRPDGRVLLAFGCTGLGIALIGGQSLAAAASPDQWLGDLLFLGGALSWGLWGVLLRKWRVAPVEAIAGMAVISALAYLPVYLLWLPKGIALATSAQIALQAVYQGFVAAVVAGLCFAYANQTIGAIRSALMLALVPGISGLAAVPLLGEPLNAWVVAGLACVTVGAVLGALRRG